MEKGDGEFQWVFLLPDDTAWVRTYGGTTGGIFSVF